MSRRRRHRSDAGDTLIEILVSVTLLGIIGAAVGGGLYVALNNAVFLRSETSPDKNIGLILQNWAAKVESFAAIQSNYANCRTDASLPPLPTPDFPPGFDGEYSVAYQYWDGGAYVGTCPSPDQGLQLLELRVTNLAGDSSLQPASRPVYVVWRKPCAVGDALC